MKATLFALFVALLMVGCGESSQPSESAEMKNTDPEKDTVETAVDRSKLQDRNGVKYLLNEETPFTGRAESFYENGQKLLEVNFKDGKKDGLQVIWHENGQKAVEGTNKNGERDGLSTSWYENGQKSLEVNFKDRKRMSTVVWKPNGEKCPVTNLKDGNGVLVWYNEDGTERIRETYKDGDIVED
tara:strand:- start:34 stop:588 length:555 start_codon:yes stop_codon:yes gene_type:complete